MRQFIPFVPLGCLRRAGYRPGPTQGRLCRIDSYRSRRADVSSMALSLPPNEDRN